MKASIGVKAVAKLQKEAQKDDRYLGLCCRILTVLCLGTTVLDNVL